MPQVRSFRELAKAIGRPKSTIERFSREPWFPKRTDEGWDVVAVRAAIDAQGSAPAPVDAADKAILAAGGDPVELARAAVRVASKRLSESGSAGALEDLREALAELGKTEKRFLDLAKEKGELIPLGDAKASCAKLGRVFVGALDRVKAKLATQVEAWRGEPLGPDGTARAVAVHAWFDKLVDFERRVTADEIDKLIAAEVAEG